MKINHFLSQAIAFYLLLVIPAFSIAQEVDKQEKANKFLVGGAFGFKYSGYIPKGSSSPLTKTYAISTSPMIGYSIKEKFMGGLMLQVSWEHSQSDIYYGRTTDYFISPFLRYYMGFPLFIQGQFNYGKSFGEQKSDFLEQISTANYSIVGAGIGVGYDFKLTNAIQFEPLVKYVWNSYKDKRPQNYINTNKDHRYLDILFNLGLVYRF